MILIIAAIGAWLFAGLVIARILAYNKQHTPYRIPNQSIMCNACKRRYATYVIDGDLVCDGCYLDLEDLGRRFVEDFEQWLQTETDPT